MVEQERYPTTRAAIEAIGDLIGKHKSCRWLWGLCYFTATRR